MAKNNIQVLKGFRDYMPDEQIARRKIIAKISEVFERFGFSPMDTPALESYELLKGKIGEEEKLIYKFEDLGGREVALRYDLTVPLARFMANNPELPKPFKRYQIGNSWRAENTQKGRFREFVQCDIDIVGSDSRLADVEVIAAMYNAYQALEIGEIIVKLNDRRIIDESLQELGVGEGKMITFLRWIDKLDKIGEEKVAEGLKADGFQGEILKLYSAIIEKNGQKFVMDMKALLSSMGVANVEFDKYLARGLDYYTGTIFEFVLKQKPEFGSIGGGGRYDELIGKVSGVATPAVGGSIGLDRMFAALQDAGLIAPQTAAEVLVMNLDTELIPEYLNITTNLRNSGLDAEFYYESTKLDKQFKYAESKNMKLAIIFGPEEAKERKVNIKDLQEKKQITVEMDDLITEVKSMLW
ncbi:MAG TPA: histidine--tRNA ligase [Verrucomicrobiae bacterium]|nr:histidine--tRNA ligase [Verrucomicrobiae bacterium]